MMWYKACEFCSVSTEERIKVLLFGNPEGKILVVFPVFQRPKDEWEQRQYVASYPDAFFVSFTACTNVENLRNAEIACSVLLRNEARRFHKILVSDYDFLRKFFGITAEGATKEDGTTILTYKGSLSDIAPEYKRLLNA